MAWSKPLFSRSQVDVAGRILAPIPWIPPIVVIGPQSVPATAPEAPPFELVPDSEWNQNDWNEALDIINNWRSAHSYPLLATRVTLTTRARKLDGRAIVAQRLKRLTSIQTKLWRNDRMALSRMHDIGGCRAVLQSVPRVDKLVQVYEDVFAKNPRVRTEFIRKYDYIAEPKTDGYRSIHLVVKYRTKSKDYLAWNGLRVEIQLRSRLQHAWATAVETVDTFTHQSLKTGGGIESWRRFFVLMGSAIAIMEKRPPCPGTPSDVHELKKELRAAVQTLNVRAVLRGWSSAMNYLPTKTVTGGAAVYLLYLDAAEEKIKVTGFSSAEQAKASEVYLSTEKMIRNRGTAQAVLVSVESIQTLRTAFPNYFADTRVFIGAVKRALVL